jgi:hypothetical protein
MSARLSKRGSGNERPPLTNSVLKSELFRTCAAPPFPAPVSADYISSRFAIVFEHIEEHLNGDVIATKEIYVRP